MQAQNQKKTVILQGLGAFLVIIQPGMQDPSRLNRITDIARFGSETYSKEELVAELGASYLVNAAGLETSSSFGNSAAYIKNWLSALKDDKRFIISAAGKAEKAVAYILDRKEVEPNAGNP